MNLTRRQFVNSTIGALAGSSQIFDRPRKAETGIHPVIDCHVHLFGVGDGGTGCLLSETVRRHWDYLIFLKLLKLREGSLDQDFVATLVKQLRESSTEKVVLLGHDGRYDSAGRFDSVNTSVFVPNDYVSRVASEHSDLIITGASVNPKRRD